MTTLPDPPSSLPARVFLPPLSQVTMGWDAPWPTRPSWGPPAARPPVCTSYREQWGPEGESRTPSGPWVGRGGGCTLQRRCVTGCCAAPHRPRRAPVRVRLEPCRGSTVWNGVHGNGGVDALELHAVWLFACLPRSGGRCQRGSTTPSMCPHGPWAAALRFNSIPTLSIWAVIAIPLSHRCESLPKSACRWGALAH